MNEIPDRDIYAIPGDDGHEWPTANDAIVEWLNHCLLPGEEPPERLTITCANYVHDQYGEQVETEEEGVYEITDLAEITINLREWCDKNAWDRHKRHSGNGC